MSDENKLKGEYSDFIGSYSCAIESSFCKDIIRAFDYYQDIGAVFCEDGQFDNSNAGRFDYALSLYEMSSMMEGNVELYLNDKMNECLEEYVNVFGHLKTRSFYSPTQKIQKTPAGGGYHVWHDEDSNLQDHARCLVWMLYLNDDYEGGETEFLYYKRRVNPEKGKLLIWPAGMTHAHRGGLVLEGTKYVATGWFYISPIGN
tara:strand:+ start:64 stop:669 length:606 start_codon:yes stop_codon:yes gene_type:complete